MVDLKDPAKEFLLKNKIMEFGENNQIKFHPLNLAIYAIDNNLSKLLSFALQSCSSFGYAETILDDVLLKKTIIDSGITNNLVQTLSTISNWVDSNEIKIKDEELRMQFAALNETVKKEKTNANRFLSESDEKIIAKNIAIENTKDGIKTIKGKTIDTIMLKEKQATELIERSASYINNYSNTIFHNNQQESIDYKINARTRNLLKTKHGQYKRNIISNPAQVLSSLSTDIEDAKNQNLQYIADKNKAVATINSITSDKFLNNLNETLIDLSVDELMKHLDQESSFANKTKEYFNNITQFNTSINENELEQISERAYKKSI